LEFEIEQETSCFAASGSSGFLVEDELCWHVASIRLNISSKSVVEGSSRILVGCAQNDNVLLLLESKEPASEGGPLQKPRTAAYEVVQIISLITRDFGIDFKGPAVDAAGEGFGSGDALLAEPVDYIEAAHTVVAVADDRFFGVELLEIRGNRAPWG